MATANVSNGPKGSKAAAGKPNPQTTAPAKPQTKQDGGRQHQGGSRKK